MLRFETRDRGKLYIRNTKKNLLEETKINIKKRLKGNKKRE